MRYLHKHGVESVDGSMLFEDVHWAPLTDKGESELWYRVSRTGDLDSKKLRRFMVEFVGDALAYQPSRHGKAIYDAIHQNLTDALARVRAKAGGEVEYTIVCHSLGTVIVSDYLYDNRATLTVTNLFTLGSPIALWTLIEGHPDKADAPVTVAEPDGVWVNIFDDDDVIGYPLRCVNAAHKKAVHADYSTEIGGPLVRHTALSHVGYWTDGNVIKPIAKKLAEEYKRLHGISYQKRRAYLTFLKSLWNI